MISGLGDRAAVLLGDRRDDDEDAVGAEHPAVAQRDVGRVADVDAVDVDHARRARACRSARRRSSSSSGRPFSPLKMCSAGDADRLGQLAVQVDALVVAVERHHVLRLGQVEHQLDLLLIAVAGGVDRRVLGRDHVAADVVEPVDRLVDRALVAGDRRRGEDDRVALVQLDLRVVAVGHAAQRAQRLALAAGRDDDELVVGEVVEPRAAGRSIPSGTSMCPSMRPMLMFLRIERPTSTTLRPCAAAASTTCWTRWMFDAKQVTTIRPSQRPKTASRFGPATDSLGEKPGRSALVESPQSSSRPSRAQLGQAADVGRLAVDRRLVELVVAGDEHRARGRCVSATAIMSGIECVRWISSMSNGPSSSVSPGLDVVEVGRP